MTDLSVPMLDLQHSLVVLEFLFSCMARELGLIQADGQRRSGQEFLPCLVELISTPQAKPSVMSEMSLWTVRFRDYASENEVYDDRAYVLVFC